MSGPLDVVEVAGHSLVSPVLLLLPVTLIRCSDPMLLLLLLLLMMMMMMLLIILLPLRMLLLLVLPDPLLLLVELLKMLLLLPLISRPPLLLLPVELLLLLLLWPLVVEAEKSRRVLLPGLLMFHESLFPVLLPLLLLLLGRFYSSVLRLVELLRVTLRDLKPRRSLRIGKRSSDGGGSFRGRQLMLLGSQRWRGFNGVTLGERKQVATGEARRSK